MASRYGRDFAPAVTIMIQLLPGVAVTYNGEEIGMENTWLTWDQTVDPQGYSIELKQRKIHLQKMI